MISISTISASLSTDDSSLLRRKIPEPKICCFFPANTGDSIIIVYQQLFLLRRHNIYQFIYSTEFSNQVKTFLVSIFAVTFTCMLVLAMYIYLIITVVQNQNPEFHREKMIGEWEFWASLGFTGQRKGELLPALTMESVLSNRNSRTR